MILAQQLAPFEQILVLSFYFLLFLSWSPLVTATLMPRYSIAVRRLAYHDVCGRLVW